MISKNSIKVLVEGMYYTGTGGDDISGQYLELEAKGSIRDQDRWKIHLHCVTREEYSA